MNILVHKSDYDLDCADVRASTNYIVDSATSVNHLKRDYYDLLSKAGNLIQVSDSLSQDEWESLTLREDTIFASVHEFPLNGRGCRVLKHSLGSLMVVGGFLGPWEFLESTINMLTSAKQETQLRNALGSACPNLGVLTPSVDTHNFRLPSKQETREARGQLNVKKNVFNLVYAGRLIANKGLTQVVRALNLWPLNRVRLIIVGDFEQDFPICHSDTNHFTFPQFFNREIIQRAEHIDISTYTGQSHDILRKIFWAADCCVYPSFHEDENFGLIPREAMLSGIPAIVTDYCGLGQLSGSATELVKTYPTLGGIRFSLLELNQKIQKIINRNESEKLRHTAFNAEFVRVECNQDLAFSSLKKSISDLLKIQPGWPSSEEWRDKKRIDHWADLGPESFKYAISLSDTLPPEGLLVDGTGYSGNRKWFSDVHFQKAIQSFYTTLPTSPIVKTNQHYRGFWRISLMHQERALVEFGFPGPRIKRFNATDWSLLIASLRIAEHNEIVFIPNRNNQTSVIQELVELGFLIPDYL